MPEFERVITTIDPDKLRRMGNAIIDIFEREDASPVEGLYCLYELRQLISKQSGIVSRPEIVNGDNETGR
jgi:hypothetical protein